jgi:hypothetical protein
MGDMVEYGEYSDDGKFLAPLFEANHSASIPHFIKFHPIRLFC